MTAVADQTLLMANDLFEGFTDGYNKRVTVRRGRRDIQLDRLTFISTQPCDGAEAGWYVDASGTGFIHQVDGEPHLAETVNVTCVMYKRMNEITDEEAQLDGFDDADHMFELMQRFYPDLGWNDEMTFVFFELEADFFGPAETDQ